MSAIEAISILDERIPVEQRPMIKEVQRVALSVISGQDSAQQYDQLDEFVERRAPKFWRFSTFYTDSGLIPIPDNDDFRVDHLNATLQRLPLDVRQQEMINKQWRKKTTTNAMKKLMLKEIKLPPPLESLTAIELFDNPYINHTLMQQLSEEGFPPFVVVEKFEQWRVEQAMGDEHQKVKYADLQRGYRAFELFLFGAGGGYFSQKLREIAKIHYVPE